MYQKRFPQSLHCMSVQAYIQAWNGSSYDTCFSSARLRVLQNCKEVQILQIAYPRMTFIVFLVRELIFSLKQWAWQSLLLPLFFMVKQQPKAEATHQSPHNKATVKVSRSWRAQDSERRIKAVSLFYTWSSTCNSAGLDTAGFLQAECCVLFMV